MLSSYIYIWFAVFEVSKYQNFHIFVFFIVEGFFFISICLKFHIDFIAEGETGSTRDLYTIRMRYLKGLFILDFIPILPLPFIFGYESNITKLFYVIKCIRIVRGIQMFNIKTFMQIIKDY